MTAKKAAAAASKKPTPHDVITSGKPRQPKTSVIPHMGANSDRQPIREHGIEDVKGVIPTIRSPERLMNSKTSPIANLSPDVAASLPSVVRDTPALDALAGLSAIGQGAPISDTTLYPWRATAALLMTVPGSAQIFTGTGWLVGPRAIITAGHCVFPRGSSYTGFVSQIEVHLGRNGLGEDPICPPITATQFACSRGWKEDGDFAYDYGFILLNDDIGNKTGWMGVSVLNDEEILGSVLNLSGYPTASPSAPVPDGKQWYVSGQPDHLDSSFIYYNFGTLPGESGCALYRNVAGQSYAIGIHVASQGNMGRAVRINAGVAENLRSWASAN